MTDRDPEQVPRDPSWLLLQPSTPLPDFERLHGRIMAAAAPELARRAASAGEARLPRAWRRPALRRFAAAAAAAVLLFVASAREVNRTAPATADDLAIAAIAPSTPESDLLAALEVDE